MLVALAVAGAAFGVATAVQASIPDSNGVAHGCYSIPGKLSNTGQLPGDLRLIDTDAGQHCNSNEGSVDLATAQVATHNQFVYTDPTPLSFPGTGQFYIYWQCGAGWVATNVGISIKSGQPLNTITLIDGANIGGVNNASTNPYGADDQWLMHGNYTQANVQFYAQLQCVRADQVYGNAYGAAPTNSASAAPAPTMHVTFKPSA